MDGFTIHRLPQWIENVPLHEFLDCARRRPPGLRKDWKFLPLLDEMRSHVPINGNDYVKDIDVLIEPGQKNHQGQVPHAHAEWTAIFYVDPGDPPVPILIEGKNSVFRVEPEPGDLIILEPGVEHWVAPSMSDRPRLSFAMLVEDPETPSKFASVRPTG